MILNSKMFHILKMGRIAGYVSVNNRGTSPYKKGDIYPNFFKISADGLMYTDQYRGFNPYSGTEYIYEEGNDKPIWYCDYIGWLEENIEISGKEAYAILRELRSLYIERIVDFARLDFTYEHNEKGIQVSFEGDWDQFKWVEKYYFQGSLIVTHFSCGGKVEV